MKHFLRIILLLSVCAGVATNLFAQYYTMPASGTVTQTTCSGVIRDPGGTSTYPTYCDSYMIIYPATPGCKVHLSGSYVTESNYDYFKVYNGTSTSGTLLGNFSGTGTCNVTSSSGPLMIYFHSDGSVQQNGFELSINCVGGCLCGSPTGVVANAGTTPSTFHGMPHKG